MGNTATLHTVQYFTVNAKQGKNYVKKYVENNMSAMEFLITVVDSKSRAHSSQEKVDCSLTCLMMKSFSNK